MVSVATELMSQIWHVGTLEFSVAELDGGQVGKGEDAAATPD